jgi:microcystin-dependent protein
MDDVLGMILPFAGPKAPRNWMFCAGQQMGIAANAALFSLLGTQFGGDGKAYFNLPDLRGRAIVSSGESPSGRQYTPGEQIGSEGVTLTVTQMPAHNHNGPIVLTMDCDSQEGTLTRALGTYPAGAAGAYATTPDGQMAAPVYSGEVSNAGGGQPFNNRPPYQVLNYIICIAGIYPSPGE